MKSFIITKTFAVDAESQQKAEDIAGMIGFVVLESNHFDVYVSDTVSVKEVE